MRKFTKTLLWKRLVTENQISDTTVLSGFLSVTTGPAPVSPPIVHKDTPIGTIGTGLVSGGFVFVTDDSERIVGLVASDDVLERLRATNEFERARWAEMSIISLARLSLSATDSTPASSVEAVMDCSVVMDQGELVGVSTENDLLLSCHRLSAVISGATLDPLTGLMNRWAYERRLIEEWNRAVRGGFSIGVIIIDLDHFKEINDTHGHIAGDTLLREVASVLEESLRSYDVVARYGGDEFIVLCLGCGPGEIRIPMVRVMEGLRNSTFTNDSTTLPISASLGAAVRHEGFAGADPAEMFSIADRCLYEAKDSRETAVWVEFGSTWEEMRTVSLDSDGMTQQGTPKSLTQ